MTHDQKLAYIKTAAPGSLLFTPYHVMMVLGNSNGTPYMIHSLASYGMETSSGVVKNRIMQVVVSKVDLMAGSGTPPGGPDDTVQYVEIGALLCNSSAKGPSALSLVTSH